MVETEHGSGKGLQPVEILHIDTAGSGEFFRHVNAPEKCDCQSLLLELFSQCCQQAGGYVAQNWQGDGGHAFFPASKESGNCIRAAEDFLSKLPILTQQTATTLGRSDADEARRRFRIKAHFGLVYLSGDSRTDAGLSEDFDAFLKHERDLAPLPDELFITEQLHRQLGSPEKSLFEMYAQRKSFGALETALFRMKSRPTNHGRILLGGERPQNITDSEWRYLKTQIISQRINVAARNSITRGLIAAGKFDPELLTNLTIRALYNYLRTVYPFQAFRVTFWKPNDRGAPTYLEKVAAFPAKGAVMGRQINLDDLRFHAVRAFNSCAPVIARCVDVARLNGDWIDFDDFQKEPSRGLHSAIQLPVYRVKRTVSTYMEMEPLGVLSVDTDKPDLFLEEELDQWAGDFVGFLANLALAAHIQSAS